MITAEIKLAELAAKFRKWLADNYSEEQIQTLHTDDPAYPEWEEIESYFSELLNSDKISSLSPQAQTNLLYLIARNLDSGQMIDWFHDTPQLSYLGNLKQADFIMLATTLLKLEHIEFDDAKGQIAACFKKFTELTKEKEELLLSYYHNPNEFTKRQALISLGKLGYADIRNLIQLSWNTVDSEYHKMSCLWVIDTYLNDAELMKKYLSLAHLYPGKYLANRVAELKKNGKYF
jgi:hypothetical protein